MAVQITKRLNNPETVESTIYQEHGWQLQIDRQIRGFDATVLIVQASDVLIQAGVQELPTHPNHVLVVSYSQSQTLLPVYIQYLSQVLADPTQTATLQHTNLAGRSDLHNSLIRDNVIKIQFEDQMFVGTKDMWFAIVNWLQTYHVALDGLRTPAQTQTLSQHIGKART